jgi:hypothetical protein
MYAGNRYSTVFKALPFLLLEQDSAKLQEWWEDNLRTECFAHKASARLMRLSSGSSTRRTG